MHRTRPTAFLALLALLFALALPLPRPCSAADDPASRPLRGTGDFGYVQTAGNSDVQTLTGTEKLEYSAGRWLFTQDAAAVWGTDDDVENTGRYLLGLRADYEVTTRMSAYALVTWRRNTFAAISRQFDEGVGLVYHALIPQHALITQPQQLDLEAGVGLSQRRTTLGVEENFTTGRIAGLYRYYLEEKAYFEGGAIYLGNFENGDDYEWDATAAVVAPLSGLLALKAGYNYHYRNAPPPGFRKWDSTFSTGIQVVY